MQRPNNLITYNCWIDAIIESKEEVKENEFIRKIMKLIQTKDYLLLIDEEAEIKTNDYFVNTIQEEVYHNNIKDYNVDKEYLKLIIAYYPLTDEAKGLDLSLLPNPFEKEIDETTLFKNLGHECFIKMKELNPSGGIKEFIRIAVEFGYKAAQSKQLELLKKTYNYGLNRGSLGLDSDFNEYIQSLSTQQLPVSFEPEYDLMNEGYDKPEDYPYQECKVLKTITNSEGKEELVGTYKYYDMEKEFVPYELAVKLKKLGCDKEFSNGKYIGILWQQAFDWFREKGYESEINRNIPEMESRGFKKYSFYIWSEKTNPRGNFTDRKLNSADTYNEARQACLEKLIELCQQ